MKTNRLATLLSLSIACVYGVTQIGCSTQEPADTSNTTAADHADHDHADHDHADHDHAGGDHSHHNDDDHDHGDHAEHEHPAHGIRGGHLINLSGDKEVEVKFREDSHKFIIYVADAAKPDTVTKVVMSTTFDGKVVDYSFEKAETDDGVVYEITSPALAAAVEMGDVVSTTLTISTTDGDTSGVYRHHAH